MNHLPNRRTITSYMLAERAQRARLALVRGELIDSVAKFRIARGLTRLALAEEVEALRRVMRKFA